jgi:clan AA aspartic protease (TIGR02281 family)
MTVAQHNQLVAQINELTDRLNLLHQQQADPEAKRKIDERAARRREGYVQAVLDLRQLVDDANASYAALAQDEGVRGALERLNQGGKVKVSLGPSRAFQANVKLLEKAEAAVLTETVRLRREGGIFWVDVTFDGKVTRPMAFDTGASDVVLPADMAAQIGLKPGSDDPTVRCQVADGSIVEAKRMTVPSMRVGRFTVRDVPCVVMPADKRDVPPLLGQTFQRHFLLKFSPEAGTLALSKVEAGEEAPPRTPPAKRPRRSDRSP